MSAAPAPVPPETRDWLGVLDVGCQECGWQPHPPGETRFVLEEAVSRWEVALTRDDAPTRPAPTTWSPVEYACHVRDMVRLLGERTTAMLTGDDPQFQNWDGDAKSVELGYFTVPPSQIAADMARQTRAALDLLGTVSGDAWQRPGHRSDGVGFTIARLAQFTSHEVTHHLHDVQA